MANDILFRWEDSPALKHHCGFCARPLNHPGVKNSCLGTHVEPCLRFHQALFMRNRGHMCASCIGSDEAHHKRHLEVCEQLRLIYEINGEDTSLIPTVDGPRDQRENGRYHDNTRPLDTDDGSQSSSADSLFVTKKRRKDAKKLAKAASRPKVITHDEIGYVGSILHLPSGAVDDGDPNNIDEVEEIEKHLRYNANVYTRGVKRSVLNSFANIRDADLEFEQEMDRILNHLKVAGLVKRNTKNKGLHGKEMKIFEGLVADLKTMIVEDLVLVKRDEMETRMRRAGYLRYANRTSFAIVEDRYTAKDWKTGERIILPDPETTTKTAVANFIHDTLTKEDQRENTPVSTNSGPDRRHLTCSHKKVGSGGKVENILPVDTNPVLNQAKPKLPQPRLTLSIVNNSSKPSTPQPAHAIRSSFASLPPSSRRAAQWIVISRPTRENAWFKTPSLAEQSQSTQVSPQKRAAEQKTIESPALQKKIKKMAQVAMQPVSLAPVVHPVEEVRKHSPVKKLPEVTKDPEHPPVSQKKAKKKVREAKRKEKKQAAQQFEAIEESGGEDNDEVKKMDQQTAAQIPLKNNAEDLCILPGSIPYLYKSENFRSSVNEMTEEEFYDGDDSPTATKTNFQFHLPPTPPLSIHDFPKNSRSASLDFIAMVPLPPPAITKNSKQVHWRKDIRDFTVDALTNPFLLYPYSCIHQACSECLFETNGVPDCPFHAPCCAFDPKRNTCYIMFPISRDAPAIGPYNRLRAKKLLAIMNAQINMKDRIMIVDSCVYKWFTRSACCHTGDAPQPRKLALEYSSYYSLGEKMGRLMKQETLYITLFRKNQFLQPQITKADLERARKGAEPKGQTAICYCYSPVTTDEEVVECSFSKCKIGRFHNKCLKGEGLERLTKWYCADCSLEMEQISTKLLNDLGRSLSGKPIPKEVDKDMAAKVPLTTADAFMAYMKGESAKWIGTAGVLQKCAIVAVTEMVVEESKVSKEGLESPVDDVD